MDVLPNQIRPGDLATVTITAAKPHFIFAAGEPVSILRTRGGDAYQARREEAEQRGIMIGMPTLKSVPRK